MTVILDGRALREALAIARETDGMTCVAMRAPIVPAAAWIAGSPDAPAVAWTAPPRPADGANGGITIAGIGIARELRGYGVRRWRQIVEASRAAPVHGAVIASARGARRCDVAALDLARPRFVGGAAFAPGAADRGPWNGFGDAWFVLPRWTYAHDGATAWLVLAVDQAEARDAPRWCDELATLGSRATRIVPTALDVAPANLDRWRAHVQAITAAIARGVCSKIVAARTCTVTLASAASGDDLLAALDARHGECIRVLVRPPGAGTLVAATPERLVRRAGNLVTCDALAGTLRRDGGDAAALLASAKDRREHDLVVRAIRDALETAGAAIHADDAPSVRELRHVLHLHTAFRATLTTPRHVLELAERLHPTPAVGGTPTAVALDWIDHHEPVARGWYASPVGWFDREGNGELAVALRSGVVVGRRAHLWAGAGIVSGSDADREFAETELKLQAMLDALGVAEFDSRTIPARESCG